MTRVLFLGMLSFCPAILLGNEGEWSRFRGPNGAGISDATTVPVQWTNEDYNWKVDLPGVGHSSPVVWDTRVVVTCSADETVLRAVVCLDTEDSQVLWRRDDPSKPCRQHRDISYATPAVAGVMYLRSRSHLFSLGGANNRRAVEPSKERSEPNGG
jgi:hypothetical protein